MNKLATPTLINHLVAEYVMLQATEAALDDYLEKVYQDGIATHWEAVAKDISRKRLAALDQILMLNCTDRETIHIRDRFIVEQDLVGYIAEMAGSLAQMERAAA